MTRRDARRSSVYAAEQMVETPRLGNAHPSIAPYETLRTSDHEIAIAVGTDRQFSRFTSALALPELAVDTRFATNRERVRNRAALLAQLESRLTIETRQHWLEILIAPACQPPP